MHPPQRVKEGVAKYFPETGPKWLEKFPQWFEGLLGRWNLSLEGEAPPGWPTNQVYLVGRRQEKLVLKVGHPSDEAETEARYLEHCRGPNLVDLKQAEAGYATLLERVIPGTPLRRSIRDQSAIAGALKLHQSLPKALADKSSFPTYRSWMEKAFQEYLGKDIADPKFSAYINTATKLFEKFPDNQYLLHGDLHHDNILAGSSGWIAIDPKGVIGPAKMEFGRFFHNFISDETDQALTPSSCRAILSARFKLGAEVLPHTAQVLIQVTFIDLVLGMCWHLNSNDTHPEGMLILEVLEEMLDSSS